MSHHRTNRIQIDGVNSAIVVSAFIGKHEGRAYLLLRSPCSPFEQPLDSQIIRLADAGFRRTFCSHVAKRGPLVHRQRCQPCSPEFHRAVQSVGLRGILPEDVQNHILSRAARIKRAHQLEANALGHVDESKLIVDQIGVFRRTHSVGQCVGGATHAGVAVSSLNEVADIDEFLTRDLMTDSRTHTVDSRVVTHASVLLEGHLQVPQTLDLVDEAPESRHAGRIQKMVFEDGEFQRVRKDVILTIFFRQKSVNLSGGELVAITTVDLSQYRIARSDIASLSSLSEQFVGDHLLYHRHRALLDTDCRQLNRTGLEFPSEWQNASVLDDEAGHRVKFFGEFREGDDLTVLKTLKHRVVTHQLAEIDVVALVDGCE